MPIVTKLILALLLALVSRENVRQANVPMFEAPKLSRGIVHNVCVSAVVPFRSLVLSHETKTLNEDKTLNQLVTAPLQKHAVGSWAFQSSVIA
jgi:hypothetical protein